MVSFVVDINSTNQRYVQIVCEQNWISQ